MENDFREMRDLLIEVRVSQQHLTQRVDLLVSNLEQRILRLEDEVRRQGERQYTTDKKVWMTAGTISAVIGLVSLVLNYMRSLQ